MKTTTDMQEVAKALLGFPTHRDIKLTRLQKESAAEGISTKNTVLTELQREVLKIALAGVCPEYADEIPSWNDAEVLDLARDWDLVKRCDDCDLYFLTDEIQPFDDGCDDFDVCPSCARERGDTTLADIDSRMNHGKW